MRGDGRVFLRSHIYWIAYWLRGEERRESAKTTDETEARRFLKQRMKEVGADQIGARRMETPSARRVMVGQLIETLRADFELRGILSAPTACHLGRAKKYFGTFYAIKLSSDDVDSHIKERLEAGDRPATVNRTLAMVKAAYKLAVKNHKLNLDSVPAMRRMSEKDGIRREFFSEQEINAIIENLPDDLKDFVRWCAATGMRKGEASQLTWNMIRDGELHIAGAVCKNGLERTLPLVGALAEIIERRRACQSIEVNGAVEFIPFIFHREGRVVSDFTKAWATATKIAGCPGKIFHSLRRSAVRRMVRAHVPPVLAKKWSGHVTDEVFFRYAILDTKDMADAFNVAEKFRETETAKESNVLPMAGAR